MIILNLIQNIALLVALAATYQVIGSRLEKKNVVYKILSGLLFGGVGLVAMLTPLNFMPGVIFDGRSIILSVSGLFGGPLVAAVAATICGSYRLWLGGPGAWVGFSVIVESATLGVVFHFLWKNCAPNRPVFSLYFRTDGAFRHAGADAGAARWNRYRSPSTNRFADTGCLSFGYDAALSDLSRLRDTA